MYDTNEYPLAYLITMRSYGTWLHGDERGSVNRVLNEYGMPRLRANPTLEKSDAVQMLHSAIVFDARQRPLIEQAIREVCRFRRYRLFAINIRTNHVHSVVSASCKPELVMNSFKSYATRALREFGVLPGGTKPWSRHGSTRYLWKEWQVEAAINYVNHGQGDALPTFLDEYEKD